MIKQRIEMAENQRQLLESELKSLVAKDPELSDKIDLVCTIPGVAFKTAITVVTETNGFELIENGKQLCSYAGMDVMHNQSGTKEGKSRISKRGNSYIRQAVYLPALTTARLAPELKAFYERINAKHSTKKVGLIAVARKLLVLIYTLWKKNEVYVPNYELK